MQDCRIELFSCNNPFPSNTLLNTPPASLGSRSWEGEQSQGEEDLDEGEEDLTQTPAIPTEDADQTNSDIDALLYSPPASLGSFSQQQGEEDLDEGEEDLTQTPVIPTEDTDQTNSDIDALLYSPPANLGSRSWGREQPQGEEDLDEGEEDLTQTPAIPTKDADQTNSDIDAFFIFPPANLGSRSWGREQPQGEEGLDEGEEDLTQTPAIPTEDTDQIITTCGKRNSEALATATTGPAAKEIFCLPAKSKRSRGEHVKDNPNAQKISRDGQKTWAETLKQVKTEWNTYGLDDYDVFKVQLELRKQTHTKARLESLLRKLQICTMTGEITPASFSADENESFLGWTGFSVCPGRGTEFRRSIQSMFPSWGKMDDKTMNDILRDARLLPAPSCSWQEAWEGHCAFVWQPKSTRNVKGVQE